MPVIKIAQSGKFNYKIFVLFVTQVLHRISEVLEPVQPLRSSELIYNPDAYQFLNQSEILNLGKHRVR